MQAEAEELHAEGIVGVQLRQHPHLGLAHDGVLRDRHRGPAAARDHVIERPTMVLSLDA